MSLLHRSSPVRAWALALLVLTCGAASAQSVALQGMLGSSALLIVNGGPPKAVAAGSVYQGVKVVSTAGDQAVVEIAGQRH
ncbi:MAG TPA: TIGR02281 family clan AA aspartic protease, partial [Ramlibacter sp.]|nr:TIGR02281 family clan AA aspartic protease [Ramlibacter sp.]